MIKVAQCNESSPIISSLFFIYYLGFIIFIHFTLSLLCSHVGLPAVLKVYIPPFQKIVLSKQLLLLLFYTLTFITGIMDLAQSLLYGKKKSTFSKNTSMHISVAELLVLLSLSWV